MRRRDLTLVLAVLVLTVTTFMSQPAYAQCTRASNAKLITAINSTTALLHWYETCADNSSAVYYQRSIDGLNTWTAPRTLFNLSDGRTAIREFEGIMVGGGTLLTAMAIERGGLPSAIYVQTSTNRGATWSAPTLVREFGGSFGFCPVLDASYEPKVGLFILRTVIQQGDKAYVFLLKSPDGINWSWSRLGGSNFPLTCEDDG